MNATWTYQRRKAAMRRDGEEAEDPLHIQYTLCSTVGTNELLAAVLLFYSTRGVALPQIISTRVARITKCEALSRVF
jgi:hypothetical protein